MYSGQFVNWNLGISLWGSTIDVILLFLLILFPKKSLKKECSGKSNVFLWIFLLLFCVFAYWSGDYYSYHDYVENANLIDYRYLTGMESMELPYWYIASYVGYSYYLWRTVVWGGALILIYVLQRLCNEYNIDERNFIFFFTVCSLVLFSYPRVALSMALGFCGFVLLQKQSSSLIKHTIFIIGGVILIIASLFFHKSAPFLIIVFLLSYFNLSKEKICLVFLFIPVIVFLMNTEIFSYMLGLNSEEDSGMLNVSKVQRYLTKDAKAHSIGNILRSVLQYIYFYSYYLFICYITFSRKKGSYQKLPRTIKTLVNSSFWIITIATCFGLANGANTVVFFYRFLAFAIIPMPIILSYYWRRSKSWLIKFTIVLALLYDIYTIFVYSFIGTIVFFT